MTTDAPRARERAQANVDALLRRLREKTAHVVLPPPERAWRMVDFSAFDEPNDPLLPVWCRCTFDYR